MKKLLILPLLASILLFSCNKEDTAVNTENSTTNTETETETTSETYTGSATLNITTKGSGFNRSNELTPEAFSIALVNFWLIDTLGNEVNVINPDTSNPAYTKENPLMLNFSDNTQINAIINDQSIASGKYDGYKMEILYMEMDLEVAFHTKWADQEEDVDSAAQYLDSAMIKPFRLYYNPEGFYCRRDFIVQLDESTTDWYWMRRAIEDQDGVRNFFIKVDTINNNHPPGGAAPQAILDLFADENFWGPESDYCDLNSTPVYINTKNAVSGVDAKMEGTLDLPDNSETTINIEIDLFGLMMYEDGQSNLTTLNDGILDLGPGFDMDTYGDHGLHPRMPIITVTEEE